MKCFRKLLLAAAITLIAAQTALRADVQGLPGEGFRQDLQELLESLSNARLLPQLSPDQEAEFLRNLLEDLAIPAVITNLATATEPQNVVALRNLSDKEGILYVHLNNFQQEDQMLVAVLAEDFRKQAGHALVLDLRHARGFSPEAEEGYLHFLQGLPVPLLILMDSATAGTPESLIRKLKKERDVLILGTPSLGIGGSGQEIKLSSGLTLRVPHSEKEQLPGSLEPDIKLEENPALFDGANTPIDPTLDPWCRHARDTLKLILALK